MDKAVEFFADQLLGIRSGTVTPALVDSVKVNCYGSQLPIKHIALAVMNQGRLTISPHDLSLMSAINLALQKNGFNSYIFSKTQVVVSVPPPSGEEKQRVEQHIRKLAEEAKISIRNIRKKERQKLTKEETQVLDRELQALTDSKIKEVEEYAEYKLNKL